MPTSMIVPMIGAIATGSPKRLGSVTSLAVGVADAGGAVVAIASPAGRMRRETSHSSRLLLEKEYPSPALRRHHPTRMSQKVDDSKRCWLPLRGALSPPRP